MTQEPRRRFAEQIEAPCHHWKHGVSHRDPTRRGVGGAPGAEPVLYVLLRGAGFDPSHDLAEFCEMSGDRSGRRLQDIRVCDGPTLHTAKRLETAQLFVRHTTHPHGNGWSAVENDPGRT